MYRHCWQVRVIRFLITLSFVIIGGVLIFKLSVDRLVDLLASSNINLSELGIGFKLDDLMNFDKFIVGILESILKI